MGGKEDRGKGSVELAFFHCFSTGTERDSPKRVNGGRAGID